MTKITDQHVRQTQSLLSNKPRTDRTETIELLLTYKYIRPKKRAALSVMCVQTNDVRVRLVVPR